MINSRKDRIKKRVRSKIIGKTDLLRLSVYRSNQYIYAQAIDDTQKITIASQSGKSIEGKTNKSEQAKKVGLELAEKLKTLKVTAVVFDRGSYRYLGRVKAVAEGLREGGITI